MKNETFLGDCLIENEKIKSGSVDLILTDLPFGTVGGSLSEFSNWYAQGAPNNSSGNIGFTVNGYANKIEDTYFWRNSLTLNLNWIKLDDKDDLQTIINLNQPPMFLKYLLLKKSLHA